MKTAGYVERQAAIDDGRGTRWTITQRYSVAYSGIGIAVPERAISSASVAVMMEVLIGLQELYRLPECRVFRLAVLPGC